MSHGVVLCSNVAEAVSCVDSTVSLDAVVLRAESCLACAGLHESCHWPFDNLGSA